MSLKRELLQAIFGATLTAIFVQFGFLSLDNSFINNVASAVIVYVATRVLGLFFLGFRR